MNIYNLLIYLATSPFEKHYEINQKFKSSDEMIKHLRVELKFNYPVHYIDCDQANEQTVYPKQMVKS